MARSGFRHLLGGGEKAAQKGEDFVLWRRAGKGLGYGVGVTGEREQNTGGTEHRGRADGGKYHRSCWWTCHRRQSVMAGVAGAGVAGMGVV